RRLDVRPIATGRAERVRPKARTMRMTVLNSGLPVSPSALSKLSRFSPAFFAISTMLRAQGTRPSASRTKSAFIFGRRVFVSSFIYTSPDWSRHHEDHAGHTLPAANCRQNLHRCVRRGRPAAGDLRAQYR